LTNKGKILYIQYKDKKIKKRCENIKVAKKELGPKCGELLLQRMYEIYQADSVAQLMTLHAARCHMLKGNLYGKFAVNLKHPVRLIFEPLEGIDKYKDKTGIRFELIKRIKIIGTGDYHGERQIKWV
jgi:proteic killer suppression protein